MQQASAVYDAQTAEQARASLKAWADTWRELAPKSVETFERDFDTTIAYFQLQGLTREWIRSTSLLERVNRQLRSMMRVSLIARKLFFLFYHVRSRGRPPCGVNAQVTME